MSPAAVRLKHIARFKDRHGHWRTYLRLPGHKAVALPGQPGSPAFMDAYNAAIAAAVRREPAGQRQPAAGSFDALAVAYYASDAFRGLRDSSQRAYRRLVEEMRRHHGDKPVRMLDAEGIRVLLAEKDRPTAANHRLRLLRALMALALERGMIRADPTAGIKRRRHQTEGYRTWSEAEIEVYEARWASGTVQRLALYLMLFTGQRRSDVVRMGPQHLVPGGIEVRQQKTHRHLVIPVHPTLAAEMTLVPKGQLVFLLTQLGKAWSPRGFYNAFIDWCRLAGLPKGLSPHGLRKAMGRRLAEAGCSEHQIMSVLGVSARTASIYTRAAQQQVLAQSAMGRIGNVVALPAFNPTQKVESGGG